jgi:hypothetical protein
VQQTVSYRTAAQQVPGNDAVQPRGCYVVVPAPVEPHAEDRADVASAQAVQPACLDAGRSFEQQTGADQLLADIQSRGGVHVSRIRRPRARGVDQGNDGYKRLVCPSERPFTKKALGGLLAEVTVLPLTVHSDRRGCLTVSAEHAASHIRDVTGGGKDIVKLATSRAASMTLGNPQEAMTGANLATKFEKCPARHLGEAQDRFNRRCALRSILRLLIRAASNTMQDRVCFTRVAEATRQSGQAKRVRSPGIKMLAATTRSWRRAQSVCQSPACSKAKAPR